MNLSSGLRQFSALFLLLLFAVPRCVQRPSDRLQPASPSEQDFRAVETAINDVLGWAVEKDFNLFFDTILDDSTFVSVTPYQRVKFGFEAVKEDTGFWASPDFRAIRHELRDLTIHFSQSGVTAWFFCYVDDINTWKGAPANWINARWTGVLEKRKGKWRVVQQHFSFPLNPR